MIKNKNILLISNTLLAVGAPLGIGYLHAYLETHSFAVESIFLDNTSISDQLLKDTIERIKPVIIGLQITTTKHILAFEIIEKIHMGYPEITIVIGGVHTTIMHEQILRKYPFVIAILGEGEETFLELATCIVKKTTLNYIKGIAFISNNILVKTPARPLIENLDKLPFPNHSLFLSKNQKTAAILTSRGCPYNCSFCCLHNITKHHVRFRSVTNIIEELTYIRNNFPNVNRIWITDDTFLIDNYRVIAFCEAVLKENFKFKFACLGRFTPISENMAKILEKTGFINIGLGLESANDLIRENAHKMITKDNVINAVRIFSRTKINLQIFLIIGLPGETYKTIKETAIFIQYLQKIKYIYFWNELFSIATVYPYTELYKNMKKAGVINDDIWLTGASNQLIHYTLENTEKTLLNMRKQLTSYTSLDYFFTFKGFLRQILVILSSSERFCILFVAFKRKFPKIIHYAKNILFFRTVRCTLTCLL